MTNLALGAMLFILAYVLRAIAPLSCTTWDEPAWIHRSARFLVALSNGNWSNTLQTGHPGVTTMWLGSLGLVWQALVTGQIGFGAIEQVASQPLLIHDATFLRQTMHLLPAAKTFLPLTHALAAMTIYLLSQALAARRYALPATLLIVLDPFHLGLSRFLHLDALTANAMLIAVLSTALFLQRKQKRWLVLSAVATALGFLTKTYALFVTPTLAILLIWDGFEQRKDLTTRVQRAAGNLTIWLAALVGASLLIWPALWRTPLRALGAVFGLAFEYATQSTSASSTFLMGQVTEQPGLLFYPLALALRSTPLALLGLPLAIISCFIPQKQQRPPQRLIVILVCFALVHLALLSLSQKKFDRYALPALLALDVTAALGLVWGAEWLWRRILRPESALRAKAWLPTSSILLATLAQSLALLAPIYPAQYLAYYNPALGGARQAARLISVGWGEGLSSVSSYLQAQPDAEEITVATWAVSVIAPRFEGTVLPLTENNLPRADYILFYVGDKQDEIPLWETCSQTSEPVYVSTLNGQEYAWLYPNDYYQEVGDRLETYQTPEEPIISNMPSAFQRRYQGSLDWQLISGHSETQVADRLNQVAADVPALFYVGYDAAQPSDTLIERQLAQSSLLLWRQPFSYGNLARYQLLPERQFGVVTPDQPVDVSFEGQLALQSYELADTTLQYRQEIGIALQFEGLRAIERDYTLFLHLLDDNGQRWGQFDGPLQDIDGATSSKWAPGSQHLCRFTMPLRAGIAPGEYQLILGLYRPDDLTRLQLFDDERPLGTTLPLKTLEVTWATVPAAPTELEIPHTLKTFLADGIQIIGYDLAPQQINSGEDLALTLYWQVTEATSVDYDLEIKIVGDAGTIAEYRQSPLPAPHTTSSWPAGASFAKQYQLPSPSDASGGNYRLSLQLLPKDTTQAPPSEATEVASLKIVHLERSFAVPSMEYKIEAQLGQQIALLGYDLPQTTLKAGGNLELVLHWQALEQPEGDYTVFTHLVGEDGKIWGQHDAPPGNGARATSTWVNGEIISDEHLISVATDAPEGQYHIVVGMYQPKSGERLAVTMPGMPDDQTDDVILPVAVTVKESS